MESGVQGEVVSISRYPVKSMGGERLSSVTVDERGIVGDRRFAVTDRDGQLASGKNTRRFRRRDRVFDFTARTEPEDGVVATDGRTVWIVGDQSLDSHLSAVMGAAVAVRPERDVAHHDAGAVSLVGTATLRWCAQHLEVDPDPRRLRVNIVVETSDPFVEEGWIGAGPIDIGGTRLAVVQRVPRCRMIDIAQDGVAPSDRWLKALATERDSNLAVYADVVSPGSVAVGDAVIA